MFQKISIRALFPILFVFLILAGGAHAQARQDYVGMPVNELPHGDLNLWSAAIPVVFDQQGWQQADKPLVQTCHGPSNADFSGEHASLIRVIDGRGRTLRQRQIASPRLVLPEDPRKQWSLAPQTAETLVVSLAEGAARLQFFENAKDLSQPDFEVDLESAVREAKDLAENAKFACRGLNPPVVPFGRTGKVALAYAIRQAAASIDTPAHELWEIMNETGSYAETFSRLLIEGRPLTGHSRLLLLNSISRF